MTYIRKYLNYKIGFYLFCLIPVAYVFRSLTLNICITLIAIIYLVNVDLKKIFAQKKKSFLHNYNFYIVIFFLLLVFSSFYNNSYSKPLVYLRFLFFYLGVVEILKINNFKITKIFFYRTIFVCVFVVSCSIILEYLLLTQGIHWPGSQKFYHYIRFSGIFFDEYIAGFYLSTFGLIGVLICIKAYENKNLYFYLSILLFFIILFVGDRSPLISYFICFVLLFLLFINKIKTIFLIITIFLLISFIKNPSLNKRYVDVLNMISIDTYWKQIDTVKKNEFTNNNDKNFFKLQNFLNTQWGAHYLTAIKIFQDNSIFGKGIRSFREECKKKKYENIQSASASIRCATHPHLVVFELLSEAGISTTIFFYLFNILVFLKIFSLDKSAEKKILQILIVLIFINILPIKPSGSIFSTSFGSIYWYLLSLTIGILNSIKQK